MASTEALLGLAVLRSKKWPVWGVKTRANTLAHQDEGVLKTPAL